MFDPVAVLVPSGWRLWWGNFSLPDGADIVGIVVLLGQVSGAMFRLQTGQLVWGKDGLLHSLPQREAEVALLALREAFSEEYLASCRDEK